MATIVADESPECSGCQAVLEQQFGPTFKADSLDVRLQVRASLPMIPILSVGLDAYILASA